MRAEIALMSGSAFAVTHHAFSSGAGRTSDGNGSHASTLKSPSYTKSVSWQHYSSPKRIKDGSSKREFIGTILQSIEAYNECLKQLDIPLPTEVIIFAPGMHSFLYDKNNQFYDLITQDLSLVEKKLLIDGVLRNPGYSGIRLNVDSDRKELLDRKSVV